MKYKITTEPDHFKSLLKCEDVDERRQIFTARYLELNDRLDLDCRGFDRLIEEAKACQAWRLIKCESFEEFCLKKLRRPPDQVNLICKGLKQCDQTKAVTPTDAMAEAADETRGPAKQSGRPKKEDKKVSNGYLLPKGGNSISRIVARLKRDHPDINARLAAGEFRSARAAGIAAGFIKVLAPLEVAKKAILKLTLTERNALISWIQTL